MKDKAAKQADGQYIPEGYYFRDDADGGRLVKKEPPPLSELLTELERLNAAATESEQWSVVGNTVYIGDQFWVMPGRVHDARIAVAARVALPRLIAELHRLLGTDTPHGRCSTCGHPNKPDGCCSRSGCCNSD